ncbi:hypothetical protein F5B21DRAFT_500932 [Xylaria acuta]|nr:hypothetical protein F5B21DRAFT_500932 [Xylaria acuta]
MPPKSSDTAATRATMKPRVKRYSRREEEEPTPAQKKRQERQDMLNVAKRRQARYLETPTELEDNGYLAKTVLFTPKLPAYPSYDETPNKRRRVDHGPKTKKLARRAPWDKDSKFKKPSLPPDPPAGTSPRDQDPVTATGRFGKLPAEIRDEILRYLLLWPHDIIVFDGWSRVFPRSRPRLNLSILYTCQVLREQGLRILFGENKFVYDLRDPAASHGHTNPVLAKVFGNSVVPINEYGHLIRYVKIKVHRSRLHFHEHRRHFEDAILKFLPGGGLAHTANLHTLTLEVPAETNRALQSRFGWGKPNEVPICRYLRKGSRLIAALFKLQIQWVRVLAWDRFGECWQTKVDMRYFAKDEQMRLEHIALDKDRKHGEPDSANDQSIPRNPAAAACYRTKDIEAMEKVWNEGVKSAVAGLLNLAWRIEGLAADPDRAVNELKLWDQVTTQASGSESHASKGLVSLPSNFRESSLSLYTRPGRGRTTPGCSNSDARKLPTRSKTNSKAKAGTVTRARTSLSRLDAFNVKDTAKEMRLLEAQQDLQMNETELGERDRLTEQWLESLPPYDPEDVQGTTGGDDLETNTADVEHE